MMVGCFVTVIEESLTGKQAFSLKKYFHDYNYFLFDVINLILLQVSLSGLGKSR